jgi:predicted PurR-regulated permease PerM
VDGNIIGPKILGNTTGLSAFWVMFAILIGGGMFGFLGILLGVPVFAIIYYIVGKLVNYGLRRRGLPIETEEYVEVSGVDVKTGNFSYFTEDKDEEND